MGKKKIVAIIPILALIISMFCFTPDSNAGVATLNLTKQKKTISVGQSFQLKLDGLKASKVKWKSSKPGVATVSKKGVVKGIKAGTTTITGKYKGLKFTITVKVKKDASDNSSEPSDTTKPNRVFLGSGSNVDVYYENVVGDAYQSDKLVLYVVNKNNEKMYVYLDYLNMDGVTADFNSSNVIMPNESRTMHWWNFDTLIKPQKTITGYIEIYDSSYDNVGEININVKLQ